MKAESVWNQVDVLFDKLKCLAQKQLWNWLLGWFLFFDRLSVTCSHGFCVEGLVSFFKLPVFFNSNNIIGIFNPVVISHGYSISINCSKHFLSFKNT